jgi:RHS repeat-associated protein
MDLNAGLTQALSDGTNTYLYGQDRIALEDTANEFFLSDALGSVRQLIDDSGVVTYAASYNPYGEVLHFTGLATTSYGYTGEWTDSYIKLIYLRSRMYSPATGHFLTRDSWQGNYDEPLSLNRWLYGYGNPINRSDPSGLMPNGNEEPCFIGGDHFCILDSDTYQGAFLDESHFEIDEAWEFWKNLNQAKGRGEMPIQLAQTSPGIKFRFKFTGRYRVDIPSGISNTELAGVGAGIWADYQKKYEGWQFDWYFPAGTHSAFETADIPSTYLAYVAVVRGFSYEKIVELLGGGHSSSTAPHGHDTWDIESWNPCDIPKCLLGSCPETSPRNDTIFLKAPDEIGRYRLLPYPTTIYIEPLNRYWRYETNWLSLK